MVVDFSESKNEIFTSVYFNLQDAATRFVVVYGGASSSKSYSVHQLELANIMDDGKGDTLVIRKYGADLRQSCFKLFQTLISNWEFTHLFEQRFSSEQRSITCKKNARQIILKGIDDSEKLKSIAGIKRIVIEEASQLLFEDFLELNRRARGLDGVQIILILNPISENHWIKTKLCDQDSPYFKETTLINCTYRDNRNLKGESFLTPADIRELERLKEIDENQYRIYVLGEWGVENKDDKFCWAFQQSQISPASFQPDRVLWVSFDFNINPLTCTLAQVFPEQQTIHAIECIKLENSDIWKMCAVLLAKYPAAYWMVTGDSTGKNRTALARDNINYYYVITQQLGITQQQIQVPAANPPIEENRLLVNAVHKNWKVLIDPVRCQPLIYDLTYVQTNALGQIIKTRTSPKKFADFLDTWRYLINSAVKQHFSFRQG
jgi:phage terminase large subunit